MYSGAKIELLDMMGDDRAVARTAWVCTNRGQDATEEDVEKLISFLATHGHGTPFEAVNLCFLVECPIFVARQWMRHRMNSFNERSMRYVHLKEEMKFFKMPEGFMAGFLENEYRVLCSDAQKLYHKIIEMAEDKRRARELARAVLPQGMFTKFQWTVNLRSLANFIWHRSAPGAQEEIRVFSDEIKRILKETGKLDVSLKALEDAKWEI